MNQVVFTLLQSLILLILFVLDKSFVGIFGLFDFFAFTVLYLMILLQLHTTRSYITVFFLFGFFVDWYNKSFLGVSSLLSIVILFVYHSIVGRFAGNKFSLFGLNFITAYILFQIWLGWNAVFSIPAFAFAAISVGVTSIMWLREY